MALNSSGQLSLAGSTAGESIAVELGKSATGQIALNDTDVRGLAGIASGAIDINTFHGKSSVYVDETDFIFPLTVGTYSVTAYRYNFKTNSATTLGGSSSTFYTQGGGNIIPSVVRDPSGNVYFYGKGSTSNSSYKNWGYVAKGGGSMSTVRYYYGCGVDHGDYGGGITWHSGYGAALGNIFPHPADSADNGSYFVSFSGSSVTNRGSANPKGWSDPDFDQYRSVDASGKPTLNGTYIGVASSLKNAGDSKIWSGSPPNSAVTGNLTGNGSRCMIAVTGTSTAACINFGRVFDNSGTELSSIGTIGSGSWRSCGSFGTAWAAASSEGYTQKINAFGSVSTSPSWTTDLSTALNGHNVIWFIGAGQTLYIVTHNSSYTVFVHKLVFNLSTGSYTKTTNTTTMTVPTQMVPSMYRYY